MTFLNPQIVAATMSISIAFAIVWLIRRDYLIHRDGIKWILIAVGILLYGVNPKINDSLGLWLGIGYPPIIVVLIGLAVVLIKLLIADIERARLQTSVTRLIQKVAILEAEVEYKKDEKVTQE